MKNAPAISVIMPAFNEEKYIKTALEGLRNQTFNDFETIVVDGNSTDRTRAIADRYAKVLVEKKRGIGRARNRGARVAKGDLLVFIDADTKPSKDLLKTYYNAFKNSDIIAATGPIFPLERASKRIDLGYKIVSVHLVKSSILLGRPSVVGLNFAVRRQVFHDVGGFNEKFITYEDWDLSLRLKKAGKISYLKNAIVYTSTRRVKEWGVSGFFAYHAGNVIRYYLLKKPKERYDPVR